MAASSFVIMPPLPKRVPAPTRRASDGGSDLRHGSNQGWRDFARFRRPFVESLDIRQDHQQIGIDRAHDGRGEVVVVAETNLLGRDRVVFVDDRDDAQTQEFEHRPPRIQEAFAILEARASEQDLSDMQPAFGEASLVEFDQSDLTDGRRRLLLANGFARMRPSEPTSADGNRARGHDHDLSAHSDDARDIAGEPRKFLRPQFSIARQRARADLQHDSLRLGDEFPGVGLGH